ncbi:MAG: hypothetical protein KGI38_11965 [Thaumarchaeota archaeon]|nr:hypothetical protein [Nitrososphaerota archaeon]
MKPKYVENQEDLEALAPQYATNKKNTIIWLEGRTAFEVWRDGQMVGKVVLASAKETHVRVAK